MLELLQGLVAVRRPLELGAFPQELKEKWAFVGSSADEVIECGNHAGQSLNLLRRGWTLHFLNCHDLIRIRFNPSSCDQAPQEFARADAECTFGRIQLQLELPEDIKYLT